MKIRFPIPEKVLDAFDAIEEWLNKPLLTFWRLELRTIDPIIGAFFVLCVGYYWYTAGWKAGVTGGLMFVFVAMCAQWFWRRD